jgi:predicted TIM-barrel fold metal-dependent hydrolase
MLNHHPQEYLLFGSDSPWEDQSASLQALADLSLDAELFTAITGTNAQELLWTITSQT